MKRTEFLKHLKKHGCELVREGANHSIYKNKINGNFSSVGRHPEPYLIAFSNLFWIDFKRLMSSCSE